MMTDDYGQFGLSLAQANPEDLKKLVGQPVPIGDYPLAMTSHELDQSSERSKSPWVGISVAFQITEGEYANRLIFQRYILQHPNPDTVAISVAQIQQLALACGLSGVEQINRNLFDELLQKDFVGKVRIEKGNKRPQHEWSNPNVAEFYADKNRVAEAFPRSVAAVQDVVQQRPMVQQPAAQQPAAVQQPVQQPAQQPMTAGGTAPIPGQQAQAPATQTAYQPQTAATMPGQAGN